QHVAESYSFGYCQARSGVVDAQIAHRRRETETALVLNCAAVHFDLFDVDWWWYRIEREVARVDHADTNQRREPQTSIAGFGDLGSIGARRGAAVNAVGI